MKKLIGALLGVVFLFSLSSCSAAQPAKIYVEPAQLNQKEKELSMLLGSSENTPVFDFMLDDTVQSMAVNTYRLRNGAWEPITQGWLEFSDVKGRLALEFDNLAEGIRIAVQSEHRSDASRYTSQETEDFSGLSRVTSILGEKEPLVYDKEILLALQVSASESPITSYWAQDFENPEQYANLGYEHVYAVTLQFSQKTVSELETSE